MTNSERIAANNTRLSALVETAESLPDAGAGGGTVETCTVTVVCSTGAAGGGIWICFVDANNSMFAKATGIGTYTFSVPKNSLFYVFGGTDYSCSAYKEEYLYFITEDTTINTTTL